MTQATATLRAFSRKAPGCLTVQISILSQVTLLRIPTGPDVVARSREREISRDSFVAWFVGYLLVGGPEWSVRMSP